MWSNMHKGGSHLHEALMHSYEAKASIGRFFDQGENFVKSPCVEDEELSDLMNNGHNQEYVMKKNATDPEVMWFGDRLLH